MGRKPRQISSTGLYHVFFRGINRQNIFEEEEDYKKILEIISQVKEKMQCEIYAYCLMSNHVHIFLREYEDGDISKIMHTLLTHYANWFNFKYLRAGTLFGSRYRSEPIEDESYYLSLIRYIHQNPLKAGIVADISDYKWSSYRDYINENNGLTDIDFTLDMLSEVRKQAIESYIELHKTVESDMYEIDKAYKKTQGSIKRQIMSVLHGREPHIIANMAIDERNKTIIQLIEMGISNSDLERATGISRGTIAKILNKRQ